jgi:O-Antigen ligase
MSIALNKLEEGFVAIWCLLMPVTSLLVIPSIKGTTLAYIFAFLSVCFVLFRLKTEGLNQKNRQYVYLLVIIALIWLGLLVGSQAGHLIDDRKDFRGAFLINDLDDKILFRSALFTQSLYFAACILIFLYFRYYFRDKWMKYVLLGGYLMAAYGVYEWLFFLIFKHPGDFIANRIYGEDHPGSWSQTVDFAGLELIRIKSFFGEPSFYSSAIILYLITAIKLNRVWLVGLLAFNGFFSTSTTCYVALLVCLLFNLILTPKGRFAGLLFLVILIAGVVALSQLYPETFRGMFEDKVSGENQSGHMRMESNENTKELFNSFTPMNWLFGIGFGYAYNQVSTAVLTNTGIIGFIIYCFAFLKPVWSLPRQGVYGGYKICMFGTFFLFNLTLSEFFLATTWMFLGLTYNKLDEYQKERRYPAKTDEGIEASGEMETTGLNGARHAGTYNATRRNLYLGQ